MTETSTSAAAIPAARQATTSAFKRPDELAEFWAVLNKEEAKELEEILALVMAYLASGGNLYITLGMLKGGTAKTMSTVYLALILGMAGIPVLIVDADPTNHSVLTWQSTSEMWPANVQVKAWASEGGDGKPGIDPKEMERRIKGSHGRFQVILTDTNPAFKNYLAAALRSMHVQQADGSVDGGTLIIPVGPDQSEMEQVPDTINFAVSVEEATGVPFEVMFLTTRGKTGTKIVRQAREQFEELDVSYFETMIRHTVTISESKNTFPSTFGDYLPVLRELIEARIA